MLLPKRCHVKLTFLDAFARLGSFVALVLLLFDAVHHTKLFYSAALLSLLPQLGSQLFPGLISFLPFMLLFVSLLFFALFSLGPFAPLVLDLCSACELVPHLTGTLHEVLVLHLLQPALIQVRKLAALVALLLRISFSWGLIFYNLKHCLVLNCAFAKLWLLVRVEALLRSFPSQMVLMSVSFFLSQFFFQGFGGVQTDNVLD